MCLTLCNDSIFSLTLSISLADSFPPRDKYLTIFTSSAGFAGTWAAS